MLSKNNNPCITIYNNTHGLIFGHASYAHYGRVPHSHLKAERRVHLSVSMYELSPVIPYTNNRTVTYIAASIYYIHGCC